MNAASRKSQQQSIKTVFTLSVRLFKREWRSGELRILALALLIAISATTSISFFTDRLAQALLNRSAEMIGGDLVVRGTRPLGSDWLKLPEAEPLEHSQITEFSTVAINREQLLLASVKAVSETYPLYGSVQLSDTRYGQPLMMDKAPTPGTVWVDPRVLDRLQVEVGDEISIGAAQFRIDSVLLLEPDRGGNYFNLAPRILMNQQDLVVAQVLQTGSRANYKYLFAGNREAVETLKARLTSKMGVGYRLLSAGEEREGAGLVLKRTQQYLALTALLAIILASIAIAVAARRYSQRQYDVSAIMRCLGATQKTIFRLYFLQLLVLVLMCGVIGTLLGWGVQAVLANVLQTSIQLVLPSSSWMPWLVGFAAGVLVLFGTALPPLWRLKSVSPLRVIRRDLAPLPVRGWMVFASAWLMLCLLVLLFTQELVLVLTLLGGLGVVVALLAGMVWALLRISKRLGLTRLGLAGRAFGRIVQRAKSHTLQITALAMTLMLMAVIGMLRFELIANWSMQIPADVPNHFAFNIMPADTDRLSQYFTDQGAAAPTLYPMVRGRLTQINGRDINAELFPDKDETPSRRSGDGINRELNLSWTSSLPTDNQITVGQWKTSLESENQLPTVSIEEGLAERLGIELRDQLEFDVAGQKLSATVTSLRSVVWESFTPNFYMLFSPGALDGLPATYVTSFRLEAEQRQTLMQLVRAFPAITILEVDALITQLQSILEQVTTLVELMLLFVLLAGLCVLLAIIQSDLDERLREGALMRALGASRRYLQTINYLEFALMGLLAGLLAMAGAELVTALLYQRVFDLKPHWHWQFWLSVPLLATLLVALVGNLATRRTVRQSPALLLKQYD